MSERVKIERHRVSLEVISSGGEHAESLANTEELLDVVLAHVSLAMFE